MSTTQEKRWKRNSDCILGYRSKLSDKCEIYTYMAGGGCTLPGKAMVLMPGEGYEGVTNFVMDSYDNIWIECCPPLLVGVGVATSVETAALFLRKH